MDINGGVYPNANGSPIFPGTTVTGPLIAGNVLQSDGTGNLAGLGETSGSANVGYAEMVQSVAGITQAAASAAGGVALNIVIPAQSQILGFHIMSTTAATGAATTLTLGVPGTANAFTATNGVVTGGALGRATAITPGTGATQIGNWDNVGNTDVRINLSAANTGSGVFTVTCRYVQGINLAS
jgi:hypothetical protein